MGNPPGNERDTGLPKAAAPTAKPPERRPPSRPGLDWIVFGVAAVLALGFVVWGVIGTTSLSNFSTNALAWVMHNTGWAFVLLASLFVLFVLWLAVGKFGNIPLGKDGEAPEFRTTSWIAMMFSAGMGIGLMFYGVAEPLFHYVAPVPGGPSRETEEAAQVAMATTMFHWTLHPWAIYAVVGIAIAYGTFRKGRRQLVSSVFTPLFGKATTKVGRVIDILAIFATLFGSAASLGLGALQIGAGMESNGWFESTTPLLVVIIGVLTVAFIASAVSGVAKGIQWLSNINMVLALVLAVFLFVVGPTVLILNLIPTSIGAYIGDLPEMAARTEASGGDLMSSWLSTWTVFYWAWWISWTPFVGMFIARISRGRTIRQFVTGVLLVPSAVSLLWFAIFGGAGIDAQRRFQDLAVDDGAGGLTVNFDGVLFQTLQHYPLASVSVVLVMILVGIFFVSGADAASVVMGTLSEKGTIEPRRRTVIFWGVVMGAVAVVMLMAGTAAGQQDAALEGLKNITIVAALPFVAVMALMCVALVKDLSSDPVVRRKVSGQQIVEGAVATGYTEHGQDNFELVVRHVDGEDSVVDESDEAGRANRGDLR